MAREKIKMISTGKNLKGVSTGYFKTEDKNKTKETKKRERIMFDPRAYNSKTGINGIHCIFKEGKVK